MHETKNIALTVWDSPKDDFNGPTLAHDFEKIDEHDHTGAPKGVQLGTGAYQNESVTGEKIAKETVEGKNIVKGTIGSEQLAPSGLVPLGAIIAWQPTEGTTIPGGIFEICDGREWKNVPNKMGAKGESELKAGKMLDMRDKFIMGADITGSVAPKPGVETGKENYNLKHAHAVNPHAHPLPNHTHPIAADGSHYHTWPGNFPIIGSYGFQQLRIKAVIAHIPFNPAETTEVLHSKNQMSGSVDEEENVMNAAGIHAHGGKTEAGGAGSTGEATANTGESLEEVNIVPKNYALVYIQRVR